MRDDISPTPNIAVTTGGQRLVYDAYVTTAGPELDGPSTMARTASTLMDLFDFAVDAIVHGTGTSCRKTSRTVRLIDAEEAGARSPAQRVCGARVGVLLGRLATEDNFRIPPASRRHAMRSARNIVNRRTERLRELQPDRIALRRQREDSWGTLTDAKDRREARTARAGDATEDASARLPNAAASFVLQSAPSDRDRVKPFHTRTATRTRP